MNIVFFATHTAFHPYGSGGVEAITKRLAHRINENDKLFMVRYGCEASTTKLSKDGTTVCNFTTFEESISFLESLNDPQVILIYIRPIEKLKLMLRNIVNPSMSFHRYITTYPRSKVRLVLDIFTSILYANGNLYVCSKRLLKMASRFSKKVYLFLPPVSDNFFRYVNKNQNPTKKLTVGYMGRIDYGKGADIALDYFEKSHIYADFKVLGYGADQDPFFLKFKDKLDQVKKNKEISLVASDPKNNNLDSLINDIDSVDVFILPYRYLQSTIDTPLVLLELLTMGKKVITSNIVDLDNMDLTFFSRIDFDDLNSYREIDSKILDIKASSSSGESLPDFSKYSVDIIVKNLMLSLGRG